VHGSPLQTFRDRLEWDVAAAPGSEARYAARVCADLGLDWSWQRPIAAALRQELQVCLAQGYWGTGLRTAGVGCVGQEQQQVALRGARLNTLAST